jgi:site-specific recombinase XerD
MTSELIIRPEDDQQALIIKETAWNSLSIESQKAYKSDYDLFFEFLENKNPRSINANDILKYIEYLEGKDYKNSTINRKVASLSKMFSVMKLAREIDINPVEMLKSLKKVTRATSKTVNVSLTLAEVKFTTKILKKSTDQDRRTSLVIRMLAMTGLRISEFCNIKNRDIEDYDSKNKIITIVGKGKKERKIFLSNSFYDEVRLQYPKKKDMVYFFYNTQDNRYNRTTLYRQIVAKFEERLDKHVRPHLIRHMYVTHKIAVEKLDIKAVSLAVGHSSATTTMDMYNESRLTVNQSQIKI